jgi:pSer/pThr/pTyr-binding forkhead associated (FHA) protein
VKRNLQEAPLLLGQTSPYKGNRWILNKVFTIGRDVGCELVIPDRQVSRFHARLTPTSRGIILEDLESKNGVHINGVQISNRVTLQDGDLIQIALTQQFLFLTSDATIPLTDYSLLPRKLQLEEKSRTVRILNQPIEPPLSALQFNILSVLVRNEGQVINRQELINEVWGAKEAVGVSNQALDALIRRVRDRIHELDPAHAYIITLRGHGIRLENPHITD